VSSLDLAGVLMIQFLLTSLTRDHLEAAKNSENLLAAQAVPQTLLGELMYVCM